jgi:hypothetical protein
MTFERTSPSEPLFDWAKERARDALTLARATAKAWALTCKPGVDVREASAWLREVINRQPLQKASLVEAMTVDAYARGKASAPQAATPAMDARSRCVLTLKNRYVDFPHSYRGVTVVETARSEGKWSGYADGLGIAAEWASGDWRAFSSAFPGLIVYSRCLDGVVRAAIDQMIEFGSLKAGSGTMPIVHRGVRIDASSVGGNWWNGSIGGRVAWAHQERAARAPIWVVRTLDWTLSTRNPQSRVIGESEVLADALTKAADTLLDHGAIKSEGWSKPVAAETPVDPYVPQHHAV